MKVIVLKVNEEVCEVFGSKENVIIFFRNSWNIESLTFDVDDEEVEFSVEDGVEYLLDQSRDVECYSEDLIERGDDYCTLSLEEFEII